MNSYRSHKQTLDRLLEMLEKGMLISRHQAALVFDCSDVTITNWINQLRAELVLIFATNLLETLLPPKTHYNHQKGCGTVTKVMKEKFHDSFAVGIIDKDKKEVQYLNEFDIVCKKDTLVLHKHKTKHHYIIQISPAIERFMLNSVDELGLNLADYQLPIDLNALRKIAKSTTSKSDKRFKKLFKDLLKGEAKDVLTIKNWIPNRK